MATLDETLALVEGLARLQQTYRIDVLKFGDVQLERSQHEFPPEPTVAPAEDDDEDLAFHSAD